jgi:hypothetical protein
MERYGFKRMTTATSQPDLGSLDSGLPLPEGVSLVSRHDIYDANQTVLLMKGGTRVSRHLLAKLLGFGVSPNAFQFQDLEGKPLERQADLLRQIAQKRLQSPVKVEPSLRSGMHQEAPRQNFSVNQRVLILEPDEKTIERLTDCLLYNQFQLDHIHPVRSKERLDWALKKYRPDVVFVAFNLGEGAHGLETLRYLRSLSQTQKLVLTVEVPSGKPDIRRKLNKTVMYYNANILFKPINRYMLRDLFESLDSAVAAETFSQVQAMSAERWTPGEQKKANPERAQWLDYQPA